MICQIMICWYLLKQANVNTHRLKWKSVAFTEHAARDGRNRFFQIQFGIGSVLKKLRFSLVRFTLKNAVQLRYYSHSLST